MSPTPDSHVRLSPTLLRLIREVATPETIAVDVGTGHGTLAFAMAPFVHHVIGVDCNPEILKEAQARYEFEKVSNVFFVVGDADTDDYRALTGEPRIDLVVANLCMSDAITQRSYEALPDNGWLAFAALEVEQWKETGRPSRFAYDADRLRRVLTQTGFVVDFMDVEREVVTFADEKAVEEFYAHSKLRQRWEREGRWATLMDYVRGGGRTITVTSRLIVRAQKAAGG